MSYVRRTVTAGQATYIKEYYTGREHPKGETRRKRSNPSGASVAEANRRAALDRLTWKLNENFAVGDLLVSPTYAGGLNKTVSWEQMQADFKEFLRRLRRAYKKRGQELKYAAVPEVGQKGARHFHVVLPFIDADVIQKVWEKHGFVDIKIVQPKKDKGVYDDIAVYMIKYSEKTRATLGNENIKRYTCSRNLREPKVEITVLVRDKFNREKPFCRKGWRVVPDSVKQYENELGYAVMEYICLRC